MEEQRHYRNGWLFRDPAILENIEHRRKRDHSRIRKCIQYGVCLAVSWQFFPEWGKAALLALIMSVALGIYEKLEAQETEAIERMETTRGMIRQLDLIIANENKVTREQIERLHRSLIRVSNGRPLGDDDWR
jgi:hypothetical protein